MIRRPPRSTRTDTLFPYTTLFRSKRRQEETVMAASLEFYFDFASPYGYIGAQRIDAIAARHGRKIDWRPMLLGAVFKVAGTQPLTEYPLKGQYSVHDFNRSAREHGIAFNMPEKFPIPTQAACRGTYWLKQTLPEQAVPFIKAA